MSDRYAAIAALEDLGLGYPPTDETPDMRPETELPPVHPTKNVTEGIRTTTQEGV